MNKNSYIYRVLNSLKHLVITTFIGLILSFFMIPINTQLSWAAPILQVLLISMFTTSMYIPFWEYGDRDANLVAFNRKEKDIFTGTKIAIVSIIPYLISSMLLLFYKLGAPSWTLLVNGFVNVQFTYIFDALLNIDKLTEPSWLSTIICMVLPLYTVIVAQIAYVLGFNHISIKEKLIYKSKK